MRSLFVLISALGLASSAAAQSPSPSDVIKRLFDAMRAQDTTGMRATFHPDMRLLATGANPQGVPRAQLVPVEAWLRGIAGAPGKPDERLFDVEQRVDGRLATVWTRYEFWMGETFSHCGYDAFQLVEDQGSWKIVAGGDTQRRDPARCGRGTAPVPETLPPAADTAAILGAINKLFDAMRTRDTAAVRTVMLDQGRLHAIGPQGMRASSLAQFQAQLLGTGPEFRERMLKPTEVRISDNLATVWTFYDFHLGEQFSHCGIDYAMLARTADGWKIAQLSYTTRREGCDKVTK